MIKQSFFANFFPTKIIATLGPASSSAEIIKLLIKEGVRLFRINFSHGGFQNFEKMLSTVRLVSKELNIPVAVIGDLAGPKIRVAQVVEKGIHLIEGQKVIFQKEDILASPPETPGLYVKFSTTFPDFIDDIKPGEKILLDDGTVHLVCLEKNKDNILCETVIGGKISSHKGINLPETDLAFSAMTKWDFQCVEFAVNNKFDFLALSFIRKAEDVKQLRNILNELGVRGIDPIVNRETDFQFSALEVESEELIPIIAKIEKPQAVVNLESILKETDIVMVARGDLGVEMDLAEVAVAQKKIIQMCRDYGIPVIVATQMLQSMINTPTPTRAEVSDVANAVFDEADAVMLSGETAVGKYPIETVRMMNRIAQKSNSFLKSSGLSKEIPRKLFTFKRRTAALAHGVRTIVNDLDSKYIVVWTQLGGGAVYLSQQRLRQPILAFSDKFEILQRLSMLYGICPIFLEQPESSQEFFKNVDRLLLDNEWAEEGDLLVFVLGEPITKMGITNEIVLHYVGETLSFVY